MLGFFTKCFVWAVGAVVFLVALFAVVRMDGSVRKEKVEVVRLKAEVYRLTMEDGEKQSKVDRLIVEREQAVVERDRLKEGAYHAEMKVKELREELEESNRLVAVRGQEAAELKARVVEAEEEYRQNIVVEDRRWRKAYKELSVAHKELVAKWNAEMDGRGNSNVYYEGPSGRRSRRDDDDEGVGVGQTLGPFLPMGGGQYVAPDGTGYMETPGGQFIRMN